MVDTNNTAVNPYTPRESGQLPDVWPEGVKLLIEVDQAESQTAGGIIIPDTKREHMQMSLTMGTILRIGPDASVRFTEDKTLKPGSRVIFARYGGYRLEERRSVEGVRSTRDLRIINDEDVLALLEDDWM